jgi:hypothetical protein
MVEETGFGGNAAAIAPQTQKAGYDFAAEVRRRANVTASDDDAANRRALERLDRVLASEQPPRTDVPRGYYLDIEV